MGWHRICYNQAYWSQAIIVLAAAKMLGGS